MQSRPIKEKRFTGRSQDLEVFLKQFERATNHEGITATIKYQEMQHWVTGAAAIVYSQFESESDPSIALKKTISKLEKTFGRKRRTARQMLDELLKGPALKETDTNQIETFILKLEQVYQRALDTNREVTFSTNETFNEILRRKLPFYMTQWAKKVTDSDEKYAATKDTKHDLTFTIFVDLCTRLNSVNANKRHISKDGDTSAAPLKSADKSATKGGKVGGQKPVDAKIAASTSSKPHKKSGAPQKGKNNAASKPTYAGVTKGEKPKGDGGTKQKPPPAQRQKPPGPAPPNAHGENQGCAACGLGNHMIARCRDFLKSDEDEKRSIVRKKGLCFLCLIHGHMAVDCPNDVTCSDCQGRHNTVFHREKAEKCPPDQNEA